MAFITPTEERLEAKPNSHELLSRALEAAEAELCELTITYSQIQRRMILLQSTTRSLRRTLDLPILNDVTLTPSGLTDACRSVLSANPTPMHPKQVRDALIEYGYPIDRHVNPLASVHGILKRLKQSGFANTIEADNGTHYIAAAHSLEAT